MFDSINEAVRSAQPDYPPEQSMAGINSFNFGCKPVGYSPGYCVCLHKLAAYERDQGLKSYPECEKAIRNKECPALAMRKEEREAGKALYFIDRNLLREEMNRRFADANAAFRPTKTPVPAPKTTTAAPATKPAPKVKSDHRLMAMPEDGYAAAINAAIAETNTAPAPITPEEPKAAAPSPSEQPKRPSLVEMARMQMGKS